ncbi:MAG: hypothetical protein JNN17_09035 [Verrucomicrobiaceae bacterium]|nr:hypothetical protein [Verrucomicrobiaceae bacterium]
MRLPLLPVLIWSALCSLAHAHPLPEIPIHASFDGQGGLSLRTEVDPRCFEPDPNVAPSVTKADFALTPAAQQDKWKTQASDYIRQTVRFLLDGAPPLEPVFEWTFTTHENAPLKNDDDVVVLTGTASVKIPPAATGFSIEATKAGSLSVILRNVVRGTALERFQVLFPGETSYVLDFKTWEPRTPPPAVIEAKDEEPVAAPVPATETSPETPNNRSMLLMLSGVALVVAFFALRAKQKPQS